MKKNLKPFNFILKFLKIKTPLDNDFMKLNKFRILLTNKVLNI